jgi:hypothetical protein
VRRLLVFLVWVGVAVPAQSANFDANGVTLGASEQEIKKAFPSALCKPLEWTSTAAERRCDDAKIVIGGIPARITLYLKKDVVQAIDLRFETKDAERMAAFLKKRYGAPMAETRDTIVDKDTKREVYKVRWERGKDYAVLTSLSTARRGEVTIARGNFEEEIYRVR